MIDKNLDVRRFLQLTVMMRAVVKALFDEDQRLLLMHNKRFVIPK